MVTIESFNTEKSFDTLSIGAASYSGSFAEVAELGVTGAGGIAVTPATPIKWKSDGLDVPVAGVCRQTCTK